jgi:hypothetical protein
MRLILKMVDELRHSVDGNTRCVWAGGTCASFPDFCDNRQFRVIYCVHSHLGVCYVTVLKLKSYIRSYICRDCLISRNMKIS